jgi:hypothetical protein
VAHRAIGPGSLVASRFRLEDLLEDHSGARFWRATDLTLARNVAVHVIPADDPRAGAVLTAARTSATVSDGHILRVLDALEEDDLVHVVHEWGSGVSLDRLLAEEVLEPRRAAWLVREVAEAITVAHRHGIAHGRLLPENVLLTDVGSVKLIGFVVAAVLHGRPPLTDDGALPPSEHESDVLNLGALLYACLTGKWPGFPPSALPQAPLDHHRVCRPRQVRPGVPKRLDVLCDQVLNPDPRTGGRRYEAAAEIGSALGDYLGDTLTGAALPVSEPTAFLDPSGLQAPQTEGTLGTYDGYHTAMPDLADLADPEATQAGLPQVPVGVRPVTGMGGAGAVPPRWVPDHPPQSEGRPGSSWMRLAATLGVLLLVLIGAVVAFSLGGDGGGDRTTRDPTPDTSATRSAPEVVTPAQVSDFDPDQDGGIPSENPAEVPLATDGDPATAWHTLRYDDGPVLAPYKAGVGLLIDLGQDTDVADVQVSLVGSPYDLQLLAAPEGAAAPTSVEGLTTVATGSGSSGSVTLAADEPVRTRFLVVWLTSLPPVSGKYQGAVAELVVRS